MKPGDRVTVTVYGKPTQFIVDSVGPSGIVFARHAVSNRLHWFHPESVTRVTAWGVRA